MNGRSNSNFEWEQICFGSRFRMINDPPFARLNEYMARNETLETSILSTRENRPRTEAPPPPMINDDLSATVNAGTHAIRNAYPLQPSHVSKTFSINNPRVSHTHDAFFSLPWINAVSCRRAPTFSRLTLLLPSPPRLVRNQESKVAKHPFLKLS